MIEDTILLLGFIGALSGIFAVLGLIESVIVRFMDKG